MQYILLKQTLSAFNSTCVIGELMEETDQSFKIKMGCNIYEMMTKPDPQGNVNVITNFVPDILWTSDQISTYQKSTLERWRYLSDKDSVLMKDYDRALTALRAKQANLVMPPKPGFQPTV